MNEYQREYAYVEKKGIKSNTTCLICGAELPKKRRSYCSDLCSKKGKASLAREEYRSIPLTSKGKEKKTSCLYCGKELPPKKSVFCSERCSRLYHESKPKAEIKPKLNAASMSEILKGMEETGLQYGEYVARYGK